MEEYRAMSNPLNSMVSAMTDPIHAMMMKRRKQMENPDETLLPISNHNSSDVKELEEFCRNNGIVGFNCGLMSPKAALRMLKMKMGVLDNESYNKSPDNKNLLLG